MSNGDDAKSRTINPIDDAKWKASEWKAPIALIERFADIW